MRAEAEFWGLRGAEDFFFLTVCVTEFSTPLSLLCRNLLFAVTVVVDVVAVC